MCFINNNSKQYTIPYASNDSETYKFDQNVGTIEQIHDKIIDDAHFNMTNELNNSFIAVDDVNIPLYYMSLQSTLTLIGIIYY